MSTDWEQELQAERERKDEFVADHPHSPIPDDEQPTFDGLEYYPPDADYRFELRLHEFDDHDTLTVETTANGQQAYVRWGEFRFELGTEKYTLTAYKQSASEDRLWVPFRDETSGATTYGAGRYLDLEPADRTTDDCGCSISIERTARSVRTRRRMNAHWYRRRIACRSVSRLANGCRTN